MKKPATLKPNVQNFPPLFFAYKQFVGWRWGKDKKGKLTKIPYMLTARKKASNTNSKTWVDAQTMVAKYEQSNGYLDGIGFVFTGDDPFIFIDHDHCIDPKTGEIDPEVQSLLIDTYTEMSPSGTGIHQYVIAKKPGEKCKKGNFEMYYSKRYATLTGHFMQGYPHIIKKQQDATNKLYAKAFGTTRPAAPAETTACVIDDTIIIETLKKSEKIKKLWDGNHSGYASHSEADLALCSEIARHAGSDPKVIDMLFRQSGLYRSKWDSRRGDSTYGADTIAKVLESPPLRKYKYHLTDTGNGERFADQHRGGVLYNHLSRKWHAWDGIRWKQDDTGKVMLKTKDTVRSMYTEAAAESDSDRRKEIAKWAKQSEARMKRKDMLTCAQCEPDIPVLPSQLDQNPWLFNVMNGTINLKDRTLLPHNPKHFITKLAPIEYDPAAGCPVWMKFLNEIMAGNQEMIGFLQRAAGYSLTGVTYEQCLFFMLGGGANGKSTFLEAFKYAAGDYAIQTDFGTFTSKKFASIRNDVARMCAARIVGATEASEDTKFDEPFLKHITGGDAITARFLYQEYFEFTPQFKIWLIANHKPIIRGGDHAIWRRIQLIPFSVRIPPKKQDPLLPEKLKKEAAGIFNWALSGCLQWQKSGMQVPDIVRSATLQYRSEMDTLSDFIDVSCVVTPLAKVAVSELHREYEKWCNLNEVEAVYINVFSQQMQRSGYEVKHTRKGRVFRGIGLKEVKRA